MCIESFHPPVILWGIFFYLYVVNKETYLKRLNNLSHSYRLSKLGFQSRQFSFRSLDHLNLPQHHCGSQGLGGMGKSHFFCLSTCSSLYPEIFHSIFAYSSSCPSSACQNVTLVRLWDFPSWNWIPFQYSLSYYGSYFALIYSSLYILLIDGYSLMRPVIDMSFSLVLCLHCYISVELSPSLLTWEPGFLKAAF